MDTLESAQSWITNGFSVIPLGWRSKRPAFGALKAVGAIDSGGRPVWEPYKHRLATDDELWLWFAGPKRNLGVVTGWNGLTVIDFDDRGAYDAWLTWASIEGGEASRIAGTTYQVFSARGVHVYLVIDEPVESYKLAGIDVKGQWGYVLAPPSVHPNGHEYYSSGAMIARCERLADAFPFERPAPHIEALAVAQTNDPWEAASKAVVCKGDSVSAAKQLLRLADLIPVVHQDRRGAWALCPFHADKSPSLRIYEDGHGHCFGCGWHGDVIDAYATLHRLSNREAIAALSTC